MIKTEEFRAKALVLFSGGLDSILTAELLRRAGVDVTAITFESPFFGSARAKASASAMLIPIEIAPVEETEYMNIVKSPSHGRGRNMNPCIDCHGYMLKIAAQMMASLGFDFIATGEVLGERPMSQNRDALDIVAKMSGIPELVLRPLSAKLLPKTLPETMRWVLPENLLAIQGRSRAMQFSLADQWGLKEYPNPSGGCLLTDPGYSFRLMDLLKENPSADFRYCALLSLGRHIRLPDGRRFIIGRNEKENNELAKAPEEEWFKIIPLAHPGPTSLMRRSEGKNTPEILRLACEIAARYSDCPEGEITRFIIKPEELTIACLPAEKHLCHRLLIRRH